MRHSILQWSLAACAQGPVNPGETAQESTPKPGPEEALEILKSGNRRFAEGKSIHPRSGPDRTALAAQADQADYAYATVLSCSDSRVPVERIFDAGVMDLFVVRVAGNVCNTDEIGCIEYGLAHVHTPVLVVLGHTQCGAVTAVTQAIHGTGHELERNIPPLVGSIEPAVRRAMSNHPDNQGNEIVPYATEENIWQGVHNLFMESPAVRNLAKAGKAKIVGAVYDVGNGEIRWLSESKVSEILAEVESNPDRAMNPMAG